MNKNDISAGQVIRSHMDEIRRRIRERIARDVTIFESSRRMPPAALIPSNAEIAATALIQARREEGLVVALYRTFIDSSKRVARMHEISAVIYSRACAAHNEAVEAHRQNERLIEEGLERLSNETARIGEAVCEQVNQILRGMYEPVPSNSAEVRLMRAFKLGLVNIEGEAGTRLQTDEYQAVKREVMQADQYRCALCRRNGNHLELHVHHIIHLSNCGTNSRANLVTLCATCHGKQHPGFRITRNLPIYRGPRKRA